MDDDGRHFVERELTSAPDRDKTTGGNFGGAGILEGILADEEFVINNGNGASAHTFTFHPRGSAADTNTFADYLAQGQSCRYSGRGIERVSIDSADSAALWRRGPRGTVFAPSNPSGAAGSGFMASISKDGSGDNEAITSTTFVMCGFGVTPGFSAKPLKTGIVAVRITCRMDSSIALANSGAVEARYGTGSAPAAGAAVVGTRLGLASVGTDDVGGSSQTTEWVFDDILALVAGTTYWFDITGKAINTVTITILNPHMTAQELAS